MHRSSWELLHAVKASCDAHLRQTFAPDYIAKESQLPFVVAYIFDAASGGDRLLMHLAADAARAFCERSGHDVLDALVKIGITVDFVVEDGFEAA
jgi:hypothetical protein